MRIINYILIIAGSISLLSFSVFDHDVLHKQTYFKMAIDTTVYPDTIVVEQDTLVAASADAFRPDTLGGWGAYSSFLANVRDSVQMEIILFRNVSDSSRWFEDSCAGTIDSLFIPSADQFVTYEQLGMSWFIRIGIDGKCLFRLISGPSPGDSFGILPIQLRYKK